MRRITLFLAAIFVLAATSALAIDPPNWAVGTFKGYNDHLKKNVKIVVFGHGDVEVTVEGQNMRRGFWGSGGYSVNGLAYYVESARDGIKVTQSTDPKNKAIYAKSGGFPGWYPQGWDGGQNPGWQDRPTWAIGSFSGRSRKWACNFELTVSQDGKAKAYVKFDDGRRENQSGRVDSNQMTLASARFNIRQSGNGFEAAEVGDSGNVIRFSRGFGSGNSGDWDWNQAVPNWAVGNFSGRSRTWECNFDLRVSSDGRARATVRFDDGRTVSQSGDVAGNRMRLDKAEFTIRRSGSGFEATEIKDPRNVIQFNGGNSGDWDWNQSAPSWAVGNFNGRSRTWECNFELRVSNGGTARATVRFDDGRVVYQNGDVAGNRMRLDKAEFTIRRAGSGFEAVETKNSSNVITFRGGNDSNDWSEDAPNWAVGTFSGRSRTWQCDFDLRVSNDGTARASVNFDDGRRVRQSGKVSGNRMKLDTAEFTIRRAGNGFEAVETKNSSNVIRFSRN